MDWAPILAYLQGIVPWASTVLMGLGAIVVIGTVIDSVIPDEKDGGFMKKAFALPLVGTLLLALKKFSPLNVKEEFLEKEEPKKEIE